MRMKNDETIKELVFCLDGSYACREREQEVQRCCRMLAAEGIAAGICGDPENAAVCGSDDYRGRKRKREQKLKAAEAPVQSSGGRLYLTDSLRLYRACRESGFAAAGYLHAGNRQESFPGASYILMQPDEVSKDSYCKIWQRLAGYPWTIAETKRLVLREVTPEDYKALYLLYDAEAKRFLTPLSEDCGKEQEILRSYAENIYGFYGYGMWGIWEKTRGELIGRVGFAPPADGSGLPELGYLVRRDCRRRGYAKEAAEAALAFAATELGMTEAALQTDAANRASIALAKVLGFAREEQEPGSEETGTLRWIKKLIAG